VSEAGGALKRSEAWLAIDGVPLAAALPRERRSHRQYLRSLITYKRSQEAGVTRVRFIVPFTTWCKEVLRNPTLWVIVMRPVPHEENRDEEDFSSVGWTLRDSHRGGCTPDAASIPWLSLSAAPDGPGIFADVAFIQRLHTVGGNPPSTPGFLGEERQVPYTADYLFYKAP
jgi:hypothetical protein